MPLWTQVVKQREECQCGHRGKNVTVDTSSETEGRMSLWTHVGNGDQNVVGTWSKERGRGNVTN